MAEGIRPNLNQVSFLGKFLQLAKRAEESHTYRSVTPSSGHGMVSIALEAGLIFYGLCRLGKRAGTGSLLAVGWCG